MLFDSEQPNLVWRMLHLRKGSVFVGDPCLWSDERDPEGAVFFRVISPRIETIWCKLANLAR